MNASGADKPVSRAAGLGLSPFLVRRDITFTYFRLRRDTKMVSF
jgi:hypothetical protein